MTEPVATLAEPTTSPRAPDPEGDPRGAKVDTLKRRARLGVILLSARSALGQLISLAGMVALARLLDPKDFGVFAIVQFALSFFIYFGDAGLGGGLIRKLESPTKRELSSVFWGQLLLSLAVVALVFAAAGLVGWIWPELPSSGPWLLRALSLGLLLATLRSVPSILMERELLFGRLGTIELATNVTYYTAAIALAWAGWGVWALTIAVLLQGVVAAGVAQALKPFWPSLVLDRKILRQLLEFGVPFQLNRIIGFLNGALTPVYAGAALGPRPLGLINWGQGTGYFPLRLVEIIGRVAFPLYSQIRGDSKLLGETFGRSVQLCGAFTAFFVALFWSLGPAVIHVVYGDKWLPALPLLYVYASAIGIGFLAPLVGAVLEATGRPSLLFRLSLFWTALNWIVVLLVTPKFGMLGFAIGYSVHVVVGNLVLVALTSRLVPHARLLRRIWAPVLAGCSSYLLGREILAPHAMTVAGFVACVVALAVFHVGLLFLFDRDGTRDALMIVPGADHERT